MKGVQRILLLIFSTSFVISFSPTLVIAQDNTNLVKPQLKRVRPTRAEVRRNRIYNVQENRGTRRASRAGRFERRREGRRGRIQDRRASREARLKERKLRRQQAIAERKTRIKEKRASISARIKEKREAFRERLQEIKDKRKQAILERLDKRYSRINERWTNHFLRVLDRLSRILDKIEARMEEAADRGVDTSGVSDTIAAARAAIADAQTTVENQAAKTYTIEIGDESTLRTDAQAVNKSLRADLSATRSTVQAAREAVRAAFQALREAVIEHVRTNRPVKATESGETATP